jgi:amino acid adenylation domain-containing protein
MLGHIKILLESIIANPEQSLSDVRMLTDAERRQILVDWNNTSCGYPSDNSLHQLFEQQVEQSPDAVAVVYGDQKLTYRQLNVRANQLARYLIKLGVGPEVLVGICLERSLEMIIGLLGILKAGGAYVPIDPSYPKERTAIMMNDAQVSILLTQITLRNLLPERAVRVVCLDEEASEISQHDVSSFKSGATARNLAYVLFTSGSTGRPKGIAIEHRSVVALVQWARHIFPAEDISGMLGSTSISWDLSVFELFVALSWGGTVILVENALQLPESPARDEVTLINTVPSAIAELVRLGGIPESVRTVNLAGEPLPTQLVDQLYQLSHIQRVYDLYGPGEDTTYSTFTLRRAGGPELIGRPINNSQTYLVDAHLQPVPIGVIGEIYMGGDGLARGYFNRADLTAESFIPDPFSNEPGTRLYKTGDMARYLPDGNIQYLGRIDHQVKIRGFRIELGDITTALNQHPNLREAVVLAREDTHGEKQLAAYVVPEQQPGPNVIELRSFLQQKLPNYMVPSAFVTLEGLPRTPNGKLNRQELLKHDFKGSARENELVAPKTATEKFIVEIWRKLLGVNEIGIYDNFFDLGGHSLLATRVISHVRDIFQVELPVHCFFDAPTVAGLTEVLENYETVPGRVSAIAQILEKIDSMDAEEIREMLHDKRKNRGV